MSGRQDAQRTNTKVRIKPRLTLPPHPDIEPTWDSVNGAAQALVVVMATSHGEARPASTAFEPVLS